MTKGRVCGPDGAANEGATTVGALPDALLFDVGNVLIEIDFGRVFARWAAHAGIDADHVRGRFAFSPEFERHERGEITSAVYFESLRHSLSIDLNDAQFLDGWNEIFVGEVAGMRGLVERASARLPIYAFSNTSEDHYRVWSRRYADLLDCFTAVYASCTLALRKPEPAAYRAVAQAMGLPLERILFFDDTAENVEGARRVGMRAVQVESINDVHRALAPLL